MVIDFTTTRFFFSLHWVLRSWSRGMAEWGWVGVLLKYFKDRRLERVIIFVVINIHNYLGLSSTYNWTSNAYIYIYSDKFFNIRGFK